MIKKENEALELFQSGCNCSQSVFGALAPLFGIDKNSSLLIASAFGGGIARTQQICGALTGALMALGLKYGRGENGTEEDKQRGYFYARKLMKEFEDKFGGINCIDLLDGLNMNLNYELMPNFSSNVFTIATVYPGASPSEVENSVTKKIEDAITTIENIDNIRSVSQEGVSVLIVSLKLKADVNEVVQDAQRKVNAMKSTLPADVKDPVISKLSIKDLPVMNIGVTSTLSPTDFYDLMKYRIQPELNRITGVGEVTLIGGNEREIRVNLDAKKMETYKLSSGQVLQAIQLSNTEFPAGKIKNNECQFNIRLSAKFKTVRDIENVVVSVDDKGSKIFLGDIAEVLDTEKESDMRIIL